MSTLRLCHEYYASTTGQICPVTIVLCTLESSLSMCPCVDLFPLEICTTSLDTATESWDQAIHCSSPFLWGDLSNFSVQSVLQLDQITEPLTPDLGLESSKQPVVRGIQIRTVGGGWGRTLVCVCWKNQRTGKLLCAGAPLWRRSQEFAANSFLLVWQIFRCKFCMIWR